MAGWRAPPRAPSWSGDGVWPPWCSLARSPSSPRRRWWRSAPWGSRRLRWWPQLAERVRSTGTRNESAPYSRAPSSWRCGGHCLRLRVGARSPCHPLRPLGAGRRRGRRCAPLRLRHAPGQDGFVIALADGSRLGLTRQVPPARPPTCLSLNPLELATRRDGHDGEARARADVFLRRAEPRPPRSQSPPTSGAAGNRLSWWVRR